MIGYLAVTVPYELWKLKTVKDMCKITPDYSDESKKCFSTNVHMSLRSHQIKCQCGNDKDFQFTTIKEIIGIRKKLIHFLGNIFIFPLCLVPKKCSSPKQWDKKDNYNNDFYCNPVFAGICSIVKKLFSQKKSNECKLFMLHNSDKECLGCGKKF